MKQSTPSGNTRSRTPFQQAQDALLLEVLGPNRRRLASLIYSLRGSLTPAQVRASVDRLSRRGLVRVEPFEKLDLLVGRRSAW